MANTNSIISNGKLSFMPMVDSADKVQSLAAVTEHQEQSAISVVDIGGIAGEKRIPDLMTMG